MNTPEHMTITLTGRAPVRIDKNLWPCIASAKDWDNTIESQANRKWRIIVRRHADGRALVYGWFTSAYEGERNRSGGELVAAGGDIPEAIKRVADSLGFDPLLAQYCIADLEPEEI